MNIIRNRIINFRVSEQEFRRLKAASTLQNARSLSEFARAAALRVAYSTDIPVSDEHTPESGMPLLERRLAALESNLTRLVEALAPIVNPANNG